MMLQGGNDRPEMSRSQSTTDNPESAPSTHSTTVDARTEKESNSLAPTWECESCGMTYENFTRLCHSCGSREFHREVPAEDQETSYYTGVVSYMAAITAPWNPYVPR